MSRSTHLGIRLCIALSAFLLGIVNVPRLLAATTLSFAAQADARVHEAYPATNYGTSSRLEVDGSPRAETYLRFTVSGVSGTVTGAKLRVYVTNGSDDGPALHASAVAWSETAITWGNRPALTSEAVQDMGKVAANAWIELDVTRLVAGDGVYSFALIPMSRNGIDLSSREAASNRPQLVVTTAVSSETPTPTPAPAPSGHPMGCRSGEVFMDAQDWWMNPDGGPGQDFGHLHTQLCWPYKATISSPIDIQVRSVLHNNPGQFRVLRVQSWSAGSTTTECGGSDAIDCINFNPVRTLATCAPTGGTLKDNGQTCVWADTLTIDPAKIARSGWQQFRFHGVVAEPDGKEMRTSTGLHAYVVNNQPRADYCGPTCEAIEARGWYTNVNYHIARIYDPPTGAVSGIWTPRVAMKRGAEGTTVKGYYAALDTDFHNNNPGTPVQEGSGEFDGRITIDTTRLANGWHKLMLKTDAFDSTTGSMHSGVQVFWFEVQN